MLWFCRRFCWQRKSTAAPPGWSLSHAPSDSGSSSSTIVNNMESWTSEQNFWQLLSLSQWNFSTIVGDAGDDDGDAEVDDGVQIPFFKSVVVASLLLTAGDVEAALSLVEEYLELMMLVFLPFPYPSRVSDDGCFDLSLSFLSFFFIDFSFARRAMASFTSPIPRRSPEPPQPRLLQLWSVSSFREVITASLACWQNYWARLKRVWYDPPPEVSAGWACSAVIFCY